jgi:serine/threonine-protein kinase RsbW
MRLAVSETITNIVRHGYRGAPGRIRLIARAGSGSVEVSVEDDAPLFDPTRGAPTPAAIGVVGGRGLRLLGSTVDELVHTPLYPSGNRLTMRRRRLRPATPA